jgi:cytochrome c oxidase assembly factor CtaG/putative copper export protein
VSTPPRQGDDALLLAVATAVTALALGLLAALATASFTGALAAQVFGPGPGVRYGLVLARTIGDLAATVTIGVLVLAAVALPVTRRGTDRTEAPAAHRPAFVLAAAGATVWALAELVLLILTYVDISGQSAGDPEFGAQLVAFARDVEAGRLIAVTCAAAAVIGLLAAGATLLRSAGLLAVAAVLTLTPAALGGHASVSVGHETAVTALGLHLLGVCVWVGGLVGLLLLAPGLHAAGSATARRYSTVAGCSYLAVAVSGAISAWLRIPSIGDLGSRYGLVVIAKTVALLLLGAAGWWHRRHTLDAMDDGAPHAFARLAAAEVALMTVTVGLAVALSQSAPPSSAEPVSNDPVTDLTGYPMPAAPTAARWLFSWQPDLMWVLICLLLAGLYLAGVRRLRARGDGWPVGRTVLWLAGLLVVLYATSGGPAMYGRVTFSGHMVMHMLMAMVAPLALVLGAPVTLALRTLRGRDDGTRGPREWVLAAIGSPVARVLSFPPVAAVLFAGSLIAFYYTPLFELSLRTHVGHELMHVHFLLTGYLFAWVLVGLDPGPRRWSHPLRLVLLLATMVFHAFFGIALLQGSGVLAQSWFAALPRDWGRSLLLDQQFGGGIAWGFGEFPTLVLAGVLAVQWSRASDREATRVDRAADRDGDAELTAYNAMLAQLAERDRR